MKGKIRVFSMLLCSLLLFPSVSEAKLPSKQSDGVPGRVALIYAGYGMSSNGPFQRLWKKEDFQPYITYTKADPQTGKLTSVNTKMFDTFLFLSPWASPRSDAKGLYDISGMNTTHTPGNKEEWKSWLEGNFVAGAQFDGLAQAVRDYARPLAPGYKAKLMVMMPYPDRSLKEWDKGISFEDMNNRIAAEKWFIDSFMSKYAQSHTSFDNKPLSDYLDFSGFYWMRENFTDGKNVGEGTLIQETNRYIKNLPSHDGHPLRSYVIPYMQPEIYPATVYYWGFEFGWLQPSYYFQNSLDRLATSNQLANRYNLGLELEVDYQAGSNSEYLKRFRDYLDFGSENGWMDTSLALYSDIDLYGQTTLDAFLNGKGSLGTSLHKTYDDLYLFLNDMYNPQTFTTMSPLSTRVGTDVHNTHSIELQAGSQLTFQLDSTKGDADLLLLDENMQPLARSERLNGYRDEISYTIPKTGTYFVRVQGKMESNYTLQILKGAVKTGSSPTTAMDLGVGSDITGSLADKEDRMYQVNLQSGQVYTITVTPKKTDMNPDLYLYADPITHEASTSLRNPGGAEQVTLTAEKTGPYYVMVRGELPTDYIINVQSGVAPRPIDGYEPKTAFQLKVGEPITHPIVKNEQLWYQVTVEQGKTYTFLTDPEANLDTDVDVFTSNADHASEKGDLGSSHRGAGLQDAVLYTASQSGNVYVRTISYAKGQYQLSALEGNQLPAGFSPEKPLELKDSNENETSPESPVYYSLQVEAGKSYALDLLSKDGKDADVDVYAASTPIDDKRIASSHKGAGETDNVVFMAKEGGTYLVKVSGKVQTRYQISASTLVTDGSSPEKGYQLNSDSPVSGSVNQGQTTFAKASLEKGKKYRIEVQGKDGSQDIDFDVYRSPDIGDGQLIAESHAPAGVTDEVTFTALDSEFIYISVRGYTKGEYTVKLIPLS